jgi:hypothetical protein
MNEEYQELKALVLETLGTTTRLEQVIRQGDAETREYVDLRIGGLRSEMNERFDGVDRRFTKVDVMIEAARDDIRLLAEHQVGFDERLRRRGK